MSSDAPLLGQFRNPLASADQLISSASQLDGVPLELERSIHFAGSLLTQAAGILLRLPQDVIAQAVVIYSRAWIGLEGLSLLDHNAADISAAAMYLVTKLSAHPKSTRSIINVFSLLDSGRSGATSIPHLQQLARSTTPPPCVSEGMYLDRRIKLLGVEAVILRVIGFQTHVALPHALCVNYLQTLGVFNHPRASELSRRVFAHLNSALLNPQRLYLTHQPSALATAAIYLSSKEVGVKLAGGQWWEVFDSDREEIGFLVVALISMEEFVRSEVEHSKHGNIPMTVAAIEAELVRRQQSANGEN